MILSRGRSPGNDPTTNSHTKPIPRPTARGRRTRTDRNVKNAPYASVARTVATRHASRTSRSLDGPPARRRGVPARAAVTRPRRVVNRYRTVRENTTHDFRRPPRTSIVSPDEVPEHGLEVVVRTLEAGHLEASVLDDRGQVSIECVRLSRPDQGF